MKKVFTVMLCLLLVFPLVGCGDNKNGNLNPSDGGTYSSRESSAVWNDYFEDIFSADSKIEAKFADMVHDVNQKDGAMTLLRTLNNGKVLYVAFEFDSMDKSIPDFLKDKNYTYDCILIRGNQPTDELTGLSKEEIEEKYKKQLFYAGGQSRCGSELGNGKNRTIFGFTFSLASESTFTGDITIVVTDMGYEKEDGTFEHVTSDNYIFHITETTNRTPVRQTIIYDNQMVGNVMLTEMNLQMSILQKEKAEELAEALIVVPGEFVNSRIKLLDRNNQEIDLRIVETASSSGESVTVHYAFDRLIDISEVYGIQVGDYIIELN